MQFSDTDNYVITDSSISLDKYTIDFWLNVQGSGGLNPRLVGPSDGLHHWIIIGDNNGLGVGFYTAVSPAQAPNAPVVGQWEHYTVTLDRVLGQAAVYRDGSPVASGAFVDGLPSDQWVFGHSGHVINHTESLSGLMDDIRIYDRVLAPGEASTLASIPEPSSFALAMLGLLA